MRYLERPDSFRERLWPTWWVFLSTALVIPASLLVFLPISPAAGVVVAIALYAAIVVALLVTTPVIEVTDGMLRVGRARIERTFVGTVSAHTGADAVAERGTRLDARAWLALRGWISGVVRIEIADDADPTPYWLVSTRRPAELAAALTK
ncbi:MAG: DUF3093 domain-containing protein [Pseudolysinimonas sp.]|uniref:DUF3093 domain-containing protein n=1 Tax=Pseudolysinimonas sp. TaxID=2680009 RepID=UPI003C76F40F